MSSDSEEEFCYTNAASILKTLKKKISLSEEQVASPQVDSSIKNEVIDLDDLDDKDSSIKTDSELDVSVVEVNDSCIVQSEDDYLRSSTNIITKIDRFFATGNFKSPDRMCLRSSTRRVTRRSRATSKRRQNQKHTKSTQNIHTIDDSESEENYEMNIKVVWMSQHLKKFSMRRFDKMQTIFKYFSETEKIPESNLIFYIDKSNVILTKTDTPHSLNMNAATIIEGGLRTIKNHSNTTNSNKDFIEIKVQFKDTKRPLIITMGRLDRMEVLMQKTAAELDVNVKKLKFYFDGDLIKSNDTVDDLHLEGGECIDCIK